MAWVVLVRQEDSQDVGEVERVAQEIREIREGQLLYLVMFSLVAPLVTVEQEELTAQ
jgi:hypothetical protein